jgi:hypothetical protein
VKAALSLRFLQVKSRPTTVTSGVATSLREAAA